MNLIVKPALGVAHKPLNQQAKSPVLRPILRRAPFSVQAVSNNDRVVSRDMLMTSDAGTTDGCRLWYKRCRCLAELRCQRPPNARRLLQIHRSTFSWACSVYRAFPSTRTTTFWVASWRSLESSYPFRRRASGDYTVGKAQLVLPSTVLFLQRQTYHRKYMAQVDAPCARTGPRAGSASTMRCAGQAVVMRRRGLGAVFQTCIRTEPGTAPEWSNQFTRALLRACMPRVA